MARPLFGPSIPQNAKACADDEALTKHMPGKPASQQLTSIRKILQRLSSAVGGEKPL
jgi:hypothetical protein